MADQLSEQVVANVKFVFSVFDKKCEGVINSEDLGTVMRLLDLNPTEADLEGFISEVTERDDNKIKIDFPELLTFIGRQMKNIKEVEELREACRIFDKDVTGHISVEEFYNILTRLGEPIGKDQLSAIMMEIDVDEEGNVNYEDFVTLITSPINIK